MKIGKYLLIGIVFDLFDWIGLGMIPLLADILDVAATVFWYKKLGVVATVGLVELVPFADVLPTNIALGYLADQKEETKG